MNNFTEDQRKELISAIQIGNIDVYNKVIEAFNRKEKLMDAAKDGDLKSIETAVDNIEVNKQFARDLMFVAVVCGNLEIVRYLCEIGVDLFLNDGNILRGARKYKQTKIAEYLEAEMSKPWMIELSRRKHTEMLAQKMKDTA